MSIYQLLVDVVSTWKIDAEMNFPVPFLRIYCLLETPFFGRTNLFCFLLCLRASGFFSYLETEEKNTLAPTALCYSTFLLN